MTANRDYDVTAQPDPSGDAMANEVVEEGNATWRRVVTKLTTNTGLSTAAAFICTANPPILVVDTNTTVVFRPHVLPVPPFTIVIDGLGPFNVHNTDGTAPVSGDFRANVDYLLHMSSVGDPNDFRVVSYDYQPARAIAGALGGEASLDARLDAMQAAITATATEVTNAREGQPNLDAKLDAMEAVTQTVIDEVVTAREGQPSLDAKLDLMENAAANTSAEVVAARDAFPNLDARLDSMTAATGGNVSQAEFDALEAEVVAARQGSLNLDARIDLTDAEVAYIMNRFAQVVDAAASADGLAYTGNTAKATGGPAMTDGRLFLVKPAVTNTGNCTLAINGGTVYPWLLSTGQQIPPNTLSNSVRYLVGFHTNAYRMVENGLRERIATLQTQVDGISTEVVNARGGNPNLDARLDGIDADIDILTDTKANKNTPVVKVGLVIGTGNDLSNQININVPKATPAMADAATDDASALTPYAAGLDRIIGIDQFARITWDGTGLDTLPSEYHVKSGWLALDASPLVMWDEELGAGIFRNIHVFYSMTWGRELRGDFYSRTDMSLGVLANDGSKIFAAEKTGEVYAHLMRINKQMYIDGRRYDIGFGIVAADYSIIATRDGLMGAEAAAALNDYEVENLSLRGAVAARIITAIARFNFPNNLFTDNGQSNATGVEGYRWPVIGNYELNKSFGEYVWSETMVGTTPPFAPRGSATLWPLAGYMKGGASGIMTQAEVEALGIGATVQGPPPGVGATHFFKRLNNNRRGLLTNPTNIAISNNVAVGGRAIDELKEGHTIGTIEYWNLIVSLFSQLNTLLGAGQWQAAAFNWEQGESEYLGSGESLNRGMYKTRLLDYITDYRTLALSYSGGLKPACFIGQVGGPYTRDTTLDAVPVNDLWVGMAQLELAIEHPGEIFMWGNLAMYYNKRQHRNYHGYLNYGLKIGQVMDVVLGGGQHWYPLMCIGQELAGTTIRRSYYVPHPPLQFKTVWECNQVTGEQVARDFPSRGFLVKDTVGNITILDVSIYKDTQIDITLSREPVGEYEVFYAPLEQMQGLGNVADSDPTNPLYIYTYEAASDYIGVNIAELVNKPFDMTNKAVAEYYKGDFRLEL